MLLSKKLLFILAIVLVSFVVTFGQELEIDPDQEQVNFNNHFDQHHLSNLHPLELAADHDHIILRAVSQRHVDWMREILDRDPEAVNANNLQGWNALMYATANNFPEIVQEVRLDYIFDIFSSSISGIVLLS